MGNTWYFVEKNDKAGPIDDTTLEKYIRDKKLGEKSYVWKKGFEDWKRIEDVAELDKYFNDTPISPLDNFDEVPFFEEENQTAGHKESLDVSDYLELEDTNKIKKVNTSATVEDKSMGINWNQISHDAQIFTIKVGMDRGAEENEYGARWPCTEGIFSAVKRMEGEYISATKEENMFHEAKMKFWVYNKIREATKIND